MQKLQLSIPEPCHENWQNMTATEQGRFCNACAKEVIDFSAMTDTQVLNYFNNLTHEKVCGRALPEQLDRVISRPEPPKKKLFWYWNYVAMFLLFFTRGSQADAQTCAKQTTELSPQNNPGAKDEVIVMGNLSKPVNRVITGKVTDKEGNPVSFAAVKIKGTKTGTSADANGNYTFRIKFGDILEISGVGFKSAEQLTGNAMIFNTILEKDSRAFAGEVVVVGFVSRNSDDYFGAEDKLNRVAVLHIKDEVTGNPLADASIIVKPENKEYADTAKSDKRGMYKIKGIKNRVQYHVKIFAGGYEPNEFTINEYDFKDRKKVWDVILRKQQTDISKALNNSENQDKPVTIVGAVNMNSNKAPLFIVDGVIWPVGKEINPDDVDSYEILKAPAAMALFGSEAANGAVVITTRKAKEIKMPEVVVTSGCGYRKIAGAMTYSRSYKYSVSNITDSIAAMKTWLSSSVKVYPNPVQRSNVFSIALKLPEAGFYNLQVTDISGKVLLKQQLSANTKAHTTQMPADSRWAAGLYYIRVFDTKNKLISKSSFIVK